MLTVNQTTVHVGRLRVVVNHRLADQGSSLRSHPCQG
jgi:hypothetical protein